jgi:glutathione S-transferase
LLPSFVTLRQQTFLFGERPTLADAALYGQALMLREADPTLVARVAPELAEHAERMDTYLRTR